MKATLLILTAALLLRPGSAAAETNEFICSFTNTEGRVFDQVRITGADALGCYAWTTNGAGSRVPWASAPEFLRKRFNYDAGTAAAALTQKTESDRAYRLWLARDTARLQMEAATLAAYKARKKAFLESLVEINGRVAQRAEGVLHVSVEETRWIGRNVNGVIVYEPLLITRVAIKNHPDFESLRTGKSVSLWAAPSGDLDYTTVTGDPKKIAMFDAAIPAEFALDPEVLAYMPPGAGAGGEKKAVGGLGAVWR